MELNVKNNKIQVEAIKSGLFDHIKEDTYCGITFGKFENDEEIKTELNAISMPEFFRGLKKEVSEYYESK